MYFVVGLKFNVHRLDTGKFTCFSADFVMSDTNLTSHKCIIIRLVIFYPRSVLAFGYCRCLYLCVCVCLSVRLSVCLCVGLCVNHLLVLVITRDPFKLGSPSLDQRCKRPG